MSRMMTNSAAFVMLSLVMTHIPSSVSFAPASPIVSLQKYSTSAPQIKSFLYLLPRDENDDDNKNTMKNINDQKKVTVQERIDEFLDTPFFDPDSILDQEEQKLVANDSEDNNSNTTQSNNPLVWFAQLVKNDYETAEALYAAGFISILVILTQELLRMVKYGDAYIPFTKIGNGSLF